MTASLDDHVRKMLAEKTEQNGGIILSMDGFQPEKVNDPVCPSRSIQRDGACCEEHEKWLSGGVANAHPVGDRARLSHCRDR